MGRPKHEVPPREGSKRNWVTQAFIANHLGVSKRAVRDMTNDGRITGYRMGKRFVRYDLNEIDAALTPYGGSVSA